MRRQAVRTVVLLSLAALLLGCGRRGPVLSGGKPVHYWVEALRDADARLRKQAAIKLGNAGPADAAVVPALRQALHDRDAAVRREAILALVKCGPAADESVPTLAALQERDRDAQVRAYAARALETLRREK
jgi:HEAT repeat protein